MAMNTLIAGIAYIGLLFGIASLYLPIAYIPLCYAIAGLVYWTVKQVSLAVEKRRERRYNIGSEVNTMGILNFGIRAYGNCAEAFNALNSGRTLYFVAITENRAKYTDGNLFQGAYCEGNTLYVEPALITDSEDDACFVGRGGLQSSILVAKPYDGEDSDWQRAYLLLDTPSNRAYALQVAGGYTADGRHILVISEKIMYSDIIEGQYAFLPCYADLIHPLSL